MREKSVKDASGRLQATILKKCSLEFHRPESNKGCAAGSCQHTCEAAGTERCPHKWTVRYVVNGAQRETSFADEMDERKRVRYGTGLRKARDFQLELTRGKRAQGATYVDPKAGAELFGPACEAFIWGGALDASPQTRRVYMSLYRSAVRGPFAGRTLAQMAGQAAADEVAALLNAGLAGRSVNYRRVARMLITGTMDAAVRSEKIGRHKLGGIRLAQAAAPAAADDDDDEGAGGFVFITDEQAALLAQGMTVADGRTGKARALAGVGIAVWLQRTMGLRICEALGVEKADLRVRANGERYLRLRSQATRDGRGRAVLKHRKEGEGRNVPVPDFVWDMAQALPDGPLCPGPRGSRYMPYTTARQRFAAVAAAMGVEGYRTHSLRHQFASESLNEGGMNVIELSAVLGHADPSVTLRTYVHVMPDADQRTRTMMNKRWPARPGLRAAA